MDMVFLFPADCIVEEVLKDPSAQTNNFLNWAANESFEIHHFRPDQLNSARMWVNGGATVEEVEVALRGVRNQKGDSLTI